MKENLQLTVRSALHKGDFRKLAYWNTFKKSPALLYLMIGMVLVGGAGLYLAAGNIIMVAVSAALMLCPFLAVGAIEFYIASVRRGGDITRRTAAEYIFGSGGISARNLIEKEPVFYKWAHIGKIYESVQFFLIFVNKVQMLTLRKSDLTPGEQQTLREIVREYAGSWKLR